MRRVLGACIFVSAALLAAGPTLSANIPPASEQVMEEVERMTLVLQERRKTKEEKLRFKNAVIHFVETDFDWPLIAERSLGPNWNDLTADQQQVFTTALRKLVQNLCLAGAKYYNGQTMKLIGEEQRGDYARVYLKCTEPGVRQNDVIVDLVARGDDWKVYDVLVDGVSLGENYQAQFTSLVQNASVMKLLEIITKKSNAQR